MTSIPSAYTEGYARGRLADASLAERYVEHTRVGDATLDPVMEEIASLSQNDLHRFIKAGIDEDEAGLREAPAALRDFFKNLEEPTWLDYDAFNAGVRAFHANTTNMLVAFVCGTLIEGFSTMIAKSFATTGRVLNRSTARRRLMQNNRHLLEVFFPGGMRRDGDGWKLSMRVRFVHARVRYLLAHSGAWRAESWGTPVSAAHLGYAMTVFSMRLLEHSIALGALFNREERDSVMAVWRYAGYVMGVPETILYTTERDARRLFEIGHLCEPPPDVDSASMANALIEAIPVTAGVSDASEQRALRTLAYSLSRPLIGNRVADDLLFPKTRTTGALFAYRLKQRFQRLRKSQQVVRSENFSQLLQISVYDEQGMSYRLPDHVYSKKSSHW